MTLDAHAPDGFLVNSFAGDDPILCRDHVRQVAGPDHVGIGSDFDGFDHPPVGLEDVSRFPYLFAELIRRGWSDENQPKLAGEARLHSGSAAQAPCAATH